MYREEIRIAKIATTDGGVAGETILLFALIKMKKFSYNTADDLHSSKFSRHIEK